MTMKSESLVHVMFLYQVSFVTRYLILYHVSIPRLMLNSLQIWPPKTVKDSGSRLHSKLKEAIVQVVLPVFFWIIVAIHC